jgi:hypothetical protein
MAGLNLSFMAKSKRKTDYIDELLAFTKSKAEKLTIKQLRTLLARHAPS